MKRCSSPSRSLNCTLRYLMSACAMVRRTVRDRWPLDIFFVSFFADARLDSVVDAMEHHRLEFCHFFDCVTRTFSSNAAAFESAVGHQIGAPHRRPIYLHRAAL